MVLSKSFGYALRGIIYIATRSGSNISIDTMSSELHIPKHFLGKVMKDIVKAGVVGSVRGKNGGFFSLDSTISYKVVEVVQIIEGDDYFNRCLLNMGNCNPGNPCPIHNKIAACKNELLSIYSTTTIGDLINHQAGSNLAHAVGL